LNASLRGGCQFRRIRNPRDSSAFAKPAPGAQSSQVVDGSGVVVLHADNPGQLDQPEISISERN
jgi:hypothetical protein